MVSCSEFASPGGEGRHRLTPNTAAFTDTSRRCPAVDVLPNDPQVDEYKAKVGPATYLGPSKLEVKGVSETSTDWPRAILPRDAETLAAVTAIQPPIAFDVLIEDKRGWNWDAVEGHMVKPKLSFAKAKRYNNACMPKEEKAACSKDYYDAEPGHKYLEKRDGPDSAGRASFVSKADRWRQQAGEAPDGADGPGTGPGMYGLPHNPMDDTFNSQEIRMRRRKSTGEDTRDNVFRQPSNQRRRVPMILQEGPTKSLAELKEEELRGGDDGASTGGRDGGGGGGGGGDGGLRRG